MDTSLTGEGQEQRVNSRGQEQTASTGPPPQITLKPGWKKTEGQFTFIFIAIAGLLSIFGFKSSPQSVQNGYQAVQTLIQTIGPLLAAVPILHKYIGARSNVTAASVLATAHMNTGTPLMTQGFLGSSAGLGDILSAIGGGGGPKDPATYLGIAKIVGQLAGGRTGQIIGQVANNPASGPGSGVDADFKAQVEAGFKSIVGSIQADERIIVGLWNILNPTKSAKSIQDVRAWVV